MVSELDQPQQHGNLIDMDDTPSNSGANQQQVNTQILIEDDYNIQQLQERERSIRQLEVNRILSNYIKLKMFKLLFTPCANICDSII